MRTSAYVRDRYLPQEFERETYQPRVMEIETDAPVVEKTPLESALENMDEETRALFKGRFEELMTKIESLEKDSAERLAASKELESQLEEAKSLLLHSKKRLNPQTLCSGFSRDRHVLKHYYLFIIYLLFLLMNLRVLTK